MGRAHHRVLHFVGRRPGITVGDLLGILAITKQSLGRVLQPMVEDGYVTQTPGRADRRQRLLTLTGKVPPWNAGCSSARRKPSCAPIARPGPSRWKASAG